MDYLLEQIHAKIIKCHVIIEKQSEDFDTLALHDYRMKYLENLHRHRRIINQEIDELLRVIDIKEITSVLQE